MIVRAPLVLADAKPRADLAVLHRLRIVLARNILGGAQYRGGQLAAHEAQISREVVHPKVVIAVRRDHVKSLGQRALPHPEHLGVEAELQDRAGARLARELGIRHLVRPRPLATGPRHADKEIGSAEPLLKTERALEDDVGAFLHGLERRLDDPVRVLESGEVDYGKARRSQRVYMLFLVIETSLEQQMEQRILDVRLVAHACRALELESGEVAAAEEIREVGCGEGQPPGGVMHVRGKG
jgi:hypothetical protein